MQGAGRQHRQETSILEEDHENKLNSLNVEVCMHVYVHVYACMSVYVHVYAFVYV
jgi:hypothetical protein